MEGLFMKIKRKAELMKELQESNLLKEKTFYKEDVEGELKEFQKLCISLIYDDEHGVNKRMNNLQDYVCKKYSVLNLERDNNYMDFMKYADEFNALIAKEIAGNNAERRVRCQIESASVNKAVLHTLELNDGMGCSGECDYIVITSKAIFIIEVKTAGSDVKITRSGNYMVKNNVKRIGNIFNLFFFMIFCFYFYLF